MVVFFHYCSRGFSNSYIIGGRFDESRPDDQKREAIIIDPTQIDEATISFIENNRYTLKTVLLTHDHATHSRGIRALTRIYENIDIYAANPVVQDCKTRMIRDGDILRASGFKIEAISTPGHSADSMVYRINHTLFTGDALTAGLVGATASNYGAMKQSSVLQNKILSLPGNYLVFPAHGPPSSLETERQFNIGLRDFEQNMRRAEKREFNLDILE